MVGTYLPATGTLGWGAWYGFGTPHSWDIPPEFLSATCGCGASPSHIFAPSTSLDGCGFFNSKVIRIPFNSISDGSEWLFYILVVILMWLCRELSHVCLHCHLHQRSSVLIKYQSFYYNLKPGWVWHTAVSTSNQWTIFEEISRLAFGSKAGAVILGSGCCIEDSSFWL